MSYYAFHSKSDNVLFYTCDDFETTISMHDSLSLVMLTNQQILYNNVTINHRLTIEVFLSDESHIPIPAGYVYERWPYGII